MTCHSSGLSLSTNTEENREKFAREEALFLLQSNLFFLIAATHLIQCMYDPPFFFLSKKDLGFFQSKRNIYSLYISRLLIRDCFFPLTCLSLAKCLKRRKRERENVLPPLFVSIYSLCLKSTPLWLKPVVKLELLIFFLLLKARLNLTFKTSLLVFRF